MVMCLYLRIYYVFYYALLCYYIFAVKSNVKTTTKQTLVAAAEQFL